MRAPQNPPPCGGGGGAHTDLDPGDGCAHRRNHHPAGGGGGRGEGRDHTKCHTILMSHQSLPRSDQTESVTAPCSLHDLTQSNFPTWTMRSPLASYNVDPVPLLPSDAAKTSSSPDPTCTIRSTFHTAPPPCPFCSDAAKTFSPPAPPAQSGRPSTQRPRCVPPALMQAGPPAWRQTVHP